MNHTYNPSPAKFYQVHLHAHTQDGARLDVAADGFGGSRFERAFFDVRVFNPYAPSNRQPQLSTTYRKHENIKKRAYDQRIRDVENSTFTPLILWALDVPLPPPTRDWRLSCQQNGISPTAPPWDGSDAGCPSLSSDQPSCALGGPDQAKGTPPDSPLST